MTDTTDVRAHLEVVAQAAAAAVADDAFDEFDTAALRSDAGLEVDGFVVWHRVADDVVVVWAGNDHDPEMAWGVVEVPVPRGALVDYTTGERIGPATADQRAASLAAGDAGVILVDSDGAVVEVGTWAAQRADVRRVFVV